MFIKILQENPLKLIAFGCFLLIFLFIIPAKLFLLSIGLGIINILFIITGFYYLFSKPQAKQVAILPEINNEITISPKINNAITILLEINNEITTENKIEPTKAQQTFAIADLKNEILSFNNFNSNVSLTDKINHYEDRFKEIGADFYQPRDLVISTTQVEQWLAKLTIPNLEDTFYGKPENYFSATLKAYFNQLVVKNEYIEGVLIKLKEILKENETISANKLKSTLSIILSADNLSVAEINVLTNIIISLLGKNKINYLQSDITQAKDILAKEYSIIQLEILAELCQTKDVNFNKYNMLKIKHKIEDKDNEVKNFCDNNNYPYCENIAKNQHACINMLWQKLANDKHNLDQHNISATQLKELIDDSTSTLNASHIPNMTSIEGYMLYQQILRYYYDPKTNPSPTQLLNFLNSLQRLVKELVKERENLIQITSQNHDPNAIHKLNILQYCCENLIAEINYYQSIQQGVCEFPNQEKNDNISCSSS